MEKKKKMTPSSFYNFMLRPQLHRNWDLLPGSSPTGIANFASKLSVFILSYEQEPQLSSPQLLWMQLQGAVTAAFVSWPTLKGIDHKYSKDSCGTLAIWAWYRETSTWAFGESLSFALSLLQTFIWPELGLTGILFCKNCRSIMTLEATHSHQKHVKNLGQRLVLLGNRCG